MNVLENTQPLPEPKPPSIEWILRMIGEDLEKVYREFHQSLSSEVSIRSDIRERLVRGGKRFRPILLLLSARLCDYQGNQHISMASHIEFIHTATLLHDDVVDGAEMRRGKKSVNLEWGNEESVLVGDLLFAKAFSLMVESGNWKILQTIARATTVMAEGELQELMKTNDLSLTEEGYLSIITRKTASLISSATQIGALLGNVSAEKENALIDFGMDVGIAFQLIDDNLDYTSREEEFGKKIGIDLQDGKITLPLIFAMSHCDKRESSFIQETVDSPPISKEAFLRVVEIIERYHGIQYTWEKAKRHIEAAKKQLQIFPDSRDRDALRALADYVIERKL